jgi:hypothetical protein
MTSLILVLAGTGIIAGIAFAILATAIIGIRQGDRVHLSNAPHSYPDAFARRILVGIRYHSQDEEERSAGRQPPMPEMPRPLESPACQEHTRMKEEMIG